MNEIPGCKSRGLSNRLLSVILLVIVSLAITYQWLANDSEDVAIFSGKTQGTTYLVKIAASFLTEVQKDQIRGVIQQRLDQIDISMSLYRNDSELVRFNQHSSTEPFSATMELIEVMQSAHQVSDTSHGAFDVTVASLVSAWGFGPEKKIGSPIPSQDEIDQLMSTVGYDKILINAEARTLQKTEANVTCTLNGIAQGYTVDKFADDLRSMGYMNLLVEVGGEVKAIGNNARGEPWRIAIEKPMDDGSEVQQVLPMRNLSVSTSGNYRDYIEKDGVRYTHIIDPHTGYPITHDLASVSVWHSQCALADAFASALMVLGPEEGFKLSEEQNLAALFITHPTGRGFEVKTTSAFENRFGNASD